MNETITHSFFGLVRLGLTVILIGLIFILDSLTPRGIPVWVLYLIPLVLTHQLPHTKTPVIVAALCAGLTFLAYFITGDLAGVPGWIPLLNRSVGAGIFPIIAYLIIQQKRMTDDLVKAATLQGEHEALQLRERLLAKNAHELQDLYDQAPCGYHSLDAQGIIIAVNQTELDWLGYTGHELVGRKRFSELVTPAGVELFHERFPRFIQEGQVSGLEFEMVRKDGTTFPVLLSATSITDLQGRFVASRSTLVDISDRKRADEILHISHQSLEREVTERTEALRISNQRLEQELIQTRNTQAALEATELRFRLMADHAPVLIWISDLTMGCIWFNNPWLEFVGRTLE